MKIKAPRKSIKSACVLAAGLIAISALLAGCSEQPVATNSTQVVGDLQIQVTSDPEEPHVGDNNLEVNLRDTKTGLPVVDANVAGTVVMTSPTLPGVTATGRSKGNGLYEIPVTYPTATTYDISIDVERPGHPAADTNISVEAAQ